MTVGLKSEFSVVLRGDLPKNDFALIKEFSRRLEYEGEPGFPLFFCTSIDTSHHYYLKMETFMPGDEVTFSLQIPHQYVLMISGSDRPLRGIGFTTSDK